MLAGDAAAELYACIQYCRARFDNPVELSRRAHVEENIRMQVAVASVKYISNPQLELFADGSHAPHDLRQLTARHNAVVDIVIGR
jgi:hypothetical protein